MKTTELSSKKILITGSSGQLGMELRHIHHEYPGYIYYFFNKSQLDITDHLQVNEIFHKIMPDFCINCAAYTAVDHAETDIENAYLINATGPRILAEACNKYNTTMVHISTDYVYHNNIKSPLKESDKTTPKSVYARSKLQGEQNILAVLDKTVIIRSSWIYSVYGNNFVKTMLKLGDSRKEISVVNDQIACPTNARDLAHAILLIINSLCKYPETEVYGIYNFTNGGQCSWYEFALEIFRLSGLSCQINPIDSAQYAAPADRPKWGVLSNDKIIGRFALKNIYWKDSLIRCLEELDN